VLSLGEYESELQVTERLLTQTWKDEGHSVAGGCPFSLCTSGLRVAGECGGRVLKTGLPAQICVAFHCGPYAEILTRV
jgi:hypothetical protein